MKEDTSVLLGVKGLNFKSLSTHQKRHLYFNSMYFSIQNLKSIRVITHFHHSSYIGISSYHREKQLMNIVNKYFSQVNLRCIFVNMKTAGSLYPFKDQISLTMSSNIIYKYCCSQCQSTYIGENQRHLISRICEHKGISPRTSIPFSNPPLSNIREHALSFHHPINPLTPRRTPLSPKFYIKKGSSKNFL